jgi:hypothetical protein
MTRGGRILAGAALGIVAATLAWPAMFSVAYGSNTGMTFAYMLSKLPEFFFILLIFAGPGALVLSCLHALLMARWAPRARTKGQIRTVGILLGILLGIANLMLVLEAVSLIWARGTGRERLYSPQMAPWLIPAAAGGAGAGLGVTLGLKPGLPEET